MALALLRIDDRLIHGQIVTTWVKEVKATNIIIANDALSKDEFIKDVITMAAPPTVKAEVKSIKETVRTINSEEFKTKRVLILTKNVEDVLALKDEGLEIKYLNVGGMGAGKNTKVIYRNISITDKQLEILRELKAQGVEIEFKLVPAEKGLKIYGGYYV